MCHRFYKSLFHLSDALFLPIICYFLFLFPFHSFPVLSLICNVISFSASIGKEYPFPKMPCILLVGKFPKPSDFPLTTYNTAQRDFDEDLREVFQKCLRFPVSLPTTDKVPKCQSDMKKSKNICNEFY